MVSLMEEPKLRRFHDVDAHRTSVANYRPGQPPDLVQRPPSSALSTQTSDPDFTYGVGSGVGGCP
jgi:hypothetical protein